MSDDIVLVKRSALREMIEEAVRASMTSPTFGNHCLPPGWGQMEVGRFAEAMGCTRAAMVKRCRKAGIPLEPFGHSLLIREEDFENRLR